MEICLCYKEKRNSTSSQGKVETVLTGKLLSSFSLRIYSVSCPKSAVNLQFPADLVIFTEEIPKERLHF